LRKHYSALITSIGSSTKPFQILVEKKLSEAVVQGSPQGQERLRAAHRASGFVYMHVPLGQICRSANDPTCARIQIYTKSFQKPLEEMGDILVGWCPTSFAF
jgi:polysaccharide deacetylase 2 family uncharacterized protein YibQ